MKKITETTSSFLKKYFKYKELKLSSEPKIIVGKELFEKMISFVNRNQYEVEWARFRHSDEDFPYCKSFTVKFSGGKYIHIDYYFRSANQFPDFKPIICIKGNKNYGNKLKPHDLSFERFEDLTWFSVTKDGIRLEKDESYDCANTICLYNEFLEMVNK